LLMDTRVLVVIGVAGSGKTTIGQLLAKVHLSCSLVSISELCPWWSLLCPHGAHCVHLLVSPLRPLFFPLHRKSRGTILGQYWANTGPIVGQDWDTFAGQCCPSPRAHPQQGLAASLYLQSR
jgi:hypothetical protein